MAVPIIPQATVLSYTLWVKAMDSVEVQIGQVLNISINESRDVTPNFVIGNDPPDQADGLIPGVVRNRTATLRRVRLFGKSLRQAFGRDDQTIVASLTDQSTPVTLKAKLVNPNDGKHKTVSLNDGFLSDISSELNMEGDIREIESCTFNFLSITETAFA